MFLFIESELCGEGCVGLSISHILDYVGSLNQLVKVSLLLYEYGSIDWETFIVNREYYELLRFNRHGQKHVTPVSQLNITSPEYYNDRWREFEITPLIKLMERRTLRGVMLPDNRFYLRGFKASHAASNVIAFTSPMVDENAAMLKVEYTSSSPLSQQTTVRKKRDLNYSVSDICSDSGSSNVDHPCCVGRRFIDLNQYTGPVKTLFRAPRNFHLQFCKGNCGG